MDPDRAADRQEAASEIARMDEALTLFLETKSSQAPSTSINQRRSDVLRACREAAELEPGLFSLTVPTGGGKTLSSLAFAISHAHLHGLSRVIYAIPFTSIIEQNADVFREALAEMGQTAVLEHHSNIESDSETPWTRLACENWDASLVVTTNVQFFESLFASRTSRCRKLHNIANSVIILDEAQMLPVELLSPCLAALKELVRNYGCTVVLCTATQPAVNRREGFPIGLEEIHEIITDPDHLNTEMKRVQVSHVGKLEDHELIDRLGSEKQVLCIVNTKAHAAELFGKLVDGKGVYHLSASMCPQHRTAKLREVKRQLKADQPCRLIATQVVEAGVDIDFPVVYRAMAGLDSIAQAAGRCNREDRLDLGHVFVFDGTAPPPPGHLRQTAETTGELIGRFDDLLGLDAIEQYFRLHYWQKKNQWDNHSIMDCFALSRQGEPICDFRAAAERFKLIPEKTRPILIPWKSRGQELINKLRIAPLPARSLRHALQRLTVSVYEKKWDQLRSSGCIEIVHEQYPVLIREDFYSPDIGLSLPDDSMII